MSLLNTVYLLLAILGGGGALGLLGYLTRGATQVARRDLTAAERQIADLSDAARIRQDLMEAQKEKLDEQGTKLAAQDAEIVSLKARVAELEARLAQLLQRLGEQVLGEARRPARKARSSTAGGTP